MVGEAAPAYEAQAHLKSFRRHLLLLKKEPDCVIILDRLEAEKPQAWTSLLHAFGAFTPAADGSFAIAGAPSVFDGKTATTKAVLSPTYGHLFADEPVSLSTGPLDVLSHPTKKPADMGYQLDADLPASKSV